MYTHTQGMPSPRFEVPSGVIDGVNTVYTVSRPYRPGSTAVFLNGALQERNLDDGWFETDPSAGTVTLKEAPRSIGLCPDVLQIFFIDTSPALPETEVTRIKGRVRTTPRLTGRLRDAQALQGRVAAASRLTGRMQSSLRVRASVVGVRRIKGTINVCA
jgi:hypothetical protein